MAELETIPSALSVGQFPWYQSQSLLEELQRAFGCCIQVFLIGIAIKALSRSAYHRYEYLVVTKRWHHPILSLESGAAMPSPSTRPELVGAQRFSPHRTSWSACSRPFRTATFAAGSISRGGSSRWCQCLESSRAVGAAVVCRGWPTEPAGAEPGHCSSHQSGAAIASRPG